MSEGEETTDESLRLKRVRLRAWRRGFREADLILGRFADGPLSTMSPEAIADFERILEQDDQDVFAWIVGAASPPRQFDNEVMAALRRSICPSHSPRGG